MTVEQHEVRKVNGVNKLEKVDGKYMLLFFNGM